jgi:crotonobetainyl-CoA:carnitine CoA-transferase CaiB-like acyl-CoA transferase
MAHARPEWYGRLHQGQVIHRLNLKDPGDRARLDALLAESDLLLTASRPTALTRLGLGWPLLHAHFPRLSQVALVGYPAPRHDQPGHDLTYQAQAGLVEPPVLPRACIADWAGAQEAVIAALALLLAQARGQRGQYVAVSLAEAAERYAEPLRHGLTTPGGLLGGGVAGYHVYPTQDGWVAVAALEPHFQQRLAEELAIPALTQDRLARAFATRTAAAWEAWAAARDLPIVAVRSTSPPCAAPRPGESLRH